MRICLKCNKPIKKGQKTNSVQIKGERKGNSISISGVVTYHKVCKQNN